MPRKDVFLELSSSERARLADLIVTVAGQNITPAKTRELLKLFRLIGAEDSDLYSRLHALQTATSGEDKLVTVRSGEKSSGFAIGRTLHKPESIERVSPVKALDTQMLQQKQEETERVYQILSSIFEEEQTAPQIVAVGETSVSITKPATVSAKATPADLIKRLAEKPVWEASAFAELARGANWLPNAAREAVNDLAFEICGDALLSGDDPIEVMVDLLPELLEEIS